MWDSGDLCQVQTCKTDTECSVSISEVYAIWMLGCFFSSLGYATHYSFSGFFVAMELFIHRLVQFYFTSICGHSIHLEHIHLLV